MRFVNRQLVNPDYQNAVGVRGHRGLHVHRRGQRDISFKIAVWNFRLAIARVMQKLNRLADPRDFNFFPVYLNGNNAPAFTVMGKVANADTAKLETRSFLGTKLSN